MKKYALCIGVDGYEDRKIRNLHTAQFDAVRMAEVLNLCCGFEYTTLIGSDVRSNKIVDAIDSIDSRLGPDDLLFYFFAGHGVEHREHGHLLLMYDARAVGLDNLLGGVLSIRSLENHVRRMVCRQVVLVLDACRGDISSTGKWSTRSGVAGISKPMGPIATRDFERLAREEKGRDFRVISSCSPDQEAVEIRGMGGVFASAFVQEVKMLFKEQREIAIGPDLFTGIRRTMDAILKEYRPGFTQHPFLKGRMDHSDRLILRHGLQILPNREIQGPQTGDVVTNSIGMKLIWIPPGKFIMGSPNNEKQRENSEGSRHRVQITNGFYMGVTPVTQIQYKRVVGTNPSFQKGDDLPVEMINWNDAVEFCRKLSEKEGKTYTLPTEAQWEYACRAGTTTPFYTGETISTDQANYDGNYTYGKGCKGKYREKITPVASFAPNAFGLSDMHGNVWEWCSDWYDRDYFSKGQGIDPQGPSSGTSRVLRGGS